MDRGKMVKREIGEWVLRERHPAGEGPYPLILMLHGWTGDENSMSVFASRMPAGAWLAAPRGLFPTPMGGYSWHTHKERVWPWLDDFQPAIQALMGLLTVENFPGARVDRFRLVGFSQGAALSYSLALAQPRRVTALAALAGFMPDGAAAQVTGQPLLDLPVLVAHGTQDELVPVEKARFAVQLLERAGAAVSYCESDVGHKLSADCFGALASFFAE